MTDGLEPTQLAEQQAALRRVATLVARAAPPEGLFALVAEEVARVVRVPMVSIVCYEDDGSAVERASFSDHGQLFTVGTRWSLDGTNVVAMVRATGRPARIDDYEGLDGLIAKSVRRAGIRSTVSSPIVVGGRQWGAMVVSSAEIEPLPEDTEDRLADFTDLVATAIANTENHASLARLAEEQAALRRVATLVARATPPDEVFVAVTREVAQLLPVENATMARYDPESTITIVASWGDRDDSYRVGTSLPLGGTNVASLIAQSGRPERIDDYAGGASGPVGSHFRDVGVGSAVGAPIIVEGKLWGLIAAVSNVEKPLPFDTEARLGRFTELLATAIANAESRAALAQLAQEQAALRRVATLVARAAEPDEVFAAVTREVAHLLPVDFACMARYDGDDAVTVIATWGADADKLPGPGAKLPLGGWNLSTRIAQTQRPARHDYSDASGVIGDRLQTGGHQSAVGAPIIVEGNLWGLISATTLRGALSSDTEARLAAFTDLLATAIANTESRGEVAASRARIVTAADETRRRIERDLHDGARQRLIALGLQLRALESSLPRELVDVRNGVSRVVESLNDVQEELMELARGIHPAILARGGLGPAISTLARRCAVPVELDVRLDGRLSERVEVPAYYVLSEALTNAVKHAHAGVVQVHVYLDEHALRIQIHDDGVGGVDFTRGSGLVGLKDRVEAFGGTMTVQSVLGAGTSLRADLPLAESPTA